jgi:hypothetical protein
MQVNRSQPRLANGVMVTMRGRGNHEGPVEEGEERAWLRIRLPMKTQ